MISKAELEELYREDDRLRAEHRAWMAQREVAASPLVKKSEPDDGLLYRTTDNALQSAPQQAADWSQWQAWLDANIAIEREGMRDEIAAFAVQMLDRERVIYDRKLAELRGENAEIKGMLLQLIGGDKAKSVGQESHDDRVVDLPRGFIRRRNDAA